MQRLAGGAARAGWSAAIPAYGLWPKPGYAGGKPGYGLRGVGDRGHGRSHGGKLRADALVAPSARVPALISGFTLLELLVVLSILGLVSALAAPPLLRTVQAWQQQSDIDSVMEQVRGLPMRARALGRTVVIDDAALSAQTPALTTPEGWSLSATRPWQVNGNGVCQPGELMLARDDRRVPILVHAPFCQPRRPALEP